MNILLLVLILEHKLGVTSQKKDNIRHLTFD